MGEGGGYLAHPLPSGNEGTLSQRHISWRLKRSSFSRGPQFEHPRQQTRRTATPTVTSTATMPPFVANQ